MKHGKEKNAERKASTLINISVKTFIQVTVLLLCLTALAIALTYIVPKGSFATLPDGSADYGSYSELYDKKGIDPVKGIFAPFLVFASEDGLTLIMLSVFLLVISGAFQIMNDVGGIRSLVDTVSSRFGKNRVLLAVAVSFAFMCFGAFLGLFEEMLTMLPVVTLLCVSAGLDSFTGFLICIVACGFGFASAITNPFTVLLASEIIGVSPTEKIWYRLIIFAVMFLLLAGFVILHIKRVSKNPQSSPTFAHDEKLRLSLTGEDGATSHTDEKRNSKTKLVYCIFLLAALAIIIVFSSVPSLRGYTVPALAAYFLIFGVIAGILACGRPGSVMKSFVAGVGGALPTIVFIALAASVKYIFDEGGIMPTLVHQINRLADGKSVFAIALAIYLVVLLLEFFISSSTAKAVLVMGLLGAVSVGLSKTMMVLLYTFADGYTNVLFPTSPVLLISLSMIGVDYFRWLKKSWWLFALNLLLVVGFIMLGIVIGY
ncbi:MAG: YfcC family protein [Clostridia bacterium]|nr:YfcC family protein [Clostridia bacterium]